MTSVGAGLAWGLLPLAGAFLLACASELPVGHTGGSGGDTGDPDPALQPATFTASVNPTPPPGYTISGDAPYRWQAYFYFEGAWVPAGPSRVTIDPAAVLVIDCNDPDLLDSCTVHRSAMITVTVAQVAPGPALLCGYKSGFRLRDDFLLSTPIGTMSLAPATSSGQDPLNQGICYP